MASYEQGGKNKRWSVRFRAIGTDGLEHNMRLSGYATRREAESAYAEYMHAHKARVLRDGRTILDNVIRRYMDELRQSVKPSTVQTVDERIRSYILPYFSGREIGTITAEEIVEWRQTLLDKRLSFRTVQSASSRLGTIMLYSEQRDGIPSIMRTVRPLRNNEPKKEMQIWTPDEFAKAMQFVEDHGLRLLYRFLFSTGCRRGEALALTVGDFHTRKENYIYIAKTFSKKGMKKGVKDNLSKEVYLSTPKNKASYRTILVPVQLMNDIKDYIHGRKKTDFVFSRDGSFPYSFTTIDRALRSAAESANLPAIRIHDLRHSHASYLISSGVSIVAVAKRLGHSDVTQTLNTYSHCLPKDDEQIARLIGAI